MMSWMKKIEVNYAASGRIRGCHRNGLRVIACVKIMVIESFIICDGGGGGVMNFY